MTGFDIYLFTRLDALSKLFRIFGIIPLVVVGIVLLALVIHCDIERKDFMGAVGKYKKWLIRFIIIGITCTFMWAILPNTKEYAAIYLIPRIANNEEVQKIPDNAMKLLNLKLQQWLTDVQGEKK